MPLTKQDKTNLENSLRLLCEISSGNFSGVVYDMGWSEVSDKCGEEAMHHLDEAHKILLKKPATVNRPVQSSDFGKMLLDLRAKVAAE